MDWPHHENDRRILTMKNSEEKTAGYKKHGTTQRDKETYSRGNSHELLRSRAGKQKTCTVESQEPAKVDKLQLPAALGILGTEETEIPSVYYKGRLAINTPIRETA